MPDQHTAATEHELFTKVAEPLDSLPDDPLAAVAADFPVALRGYDRFAVDAYVERTTQLVAELQSTRSPEAAVRRALERVGEEISGILQRAHDTADEITARSRAEAEERLETARQEAIEITGDAERRVKDLDAETERIWAERHSIVVDASELARRLTELAGSALERFPADASTPVAPPEPAHVFDGAVEAEQPEALALDGEPEADEPTAALPAPDQPPAADEPTAALPTPDQPSVEPAPVDEPTVAMPPLDPWAGEGGHMDAGPP
jgi:cell division septum initiation protein DivIVA